MEDQSYEAFCADVYDQNSCQEIKSRGYCQKFPRSMRTTCGITCNLCVLKTKNNSTAMIQEAGRWSVSACCSKTCLFFFLEASAKHLTFFPTLQLTLMGLKLSGIVCTCFVTIFHLQHCFSLVLYRRVWIFVKMKILSVYNFFFLSRAVRNRLISLNLVGSSLASQEFEPLEHAREADSFLRFLIQDIFRY